MNESHNSVTQEPKKIKEELNRGMSALDKLRNETNFSPLISVINSLIPAEERSKYERTFRSGETIFSPGEDKHIYVLMSGEIAIQTQSRTGDKTIAKIHGVNTIGEGTIFGRSFKPVKAIAGSDARVYIFSDTDLVHFESIDPSMMHRFYRLVMAKMNHHLREANHQLSEYQSLMQQLSVYLSSNGEGLLDMLVYLTNAFCLERVILIENHPLIPEIRVVRFDSHISESELLYRNSDEYGEQIRTDHSYNYSLKVAGSEIATLTLIASSEEPLLPKDQQVIERSLTTMGAVLHAHQENENKKMLDRKSANQDLHDIIF